MGKSKYSNKLLENQCCKIGLPTPIPEYRFHPVRRWRFDLAWVDWQIAIEVDGGLFVGGRHSRGAGQLKDNEKLNTAAAMGWCVLRFTPRELREGKWCKLVLDSFRRAIAAETVWLESDKPTLPAHSKPIHAADDFEEKLPD